MSLDTRNIKVIFDLDGTLIDTEKLYRKYWPMALADYGYELSDERALMLRSLGRPFAPAQFKEWYGEDFDYNLVRNRRKEYVEGYIEKNGVELRPGVKEILEYLRDKKITVAIATATDYERTDKYLNMTGIREYFEHIICATMVEHGKPAPDIYEYACSKLNANPSDCFAVEDAPNGVKSAHAAGLKVIFVADQAPADDSIKDMLYADLPIISDIKNIL
ncbi:MAG: HAD family phosphatase [Lachnospiraceae bacterium]|nr:HAD family phosphatase [Lachnospiraceae bacterium]